MICPIAHARCIVLAVLAAIAGCSRPAPQAPPAPDAVSPVVRGARAGLELHIWAIRDAGPAAEALGAPGALGKALGSWFEAPGAVSAGDRELWASNGLRLVSVPLSRVGEIQSALGSPGAIQRQWLGEHPEWMELVRGPQSPRQVVRLDSGLMTLDVGRLRLLGRCWVSPRLPRSGAEPLAEVRVDLAVQHQGPVRSRSLRELVDRPQRTPIEEAGVVFSRFVLELGLGGDEALLIVPERPEADWSGGSASSADDPAPAPGGSGLAGPPAPRLPTLGEAMLWSDAGAARPVRVIIALIPRLPDRLELAAAPVAR